MANSQLPQLKSVERLSPRVIRILGGNPGKFTLQGTNTYLVGTGPKRILIDAAHGYEEWAESLSSVLKSEGATVSSCLLTHWHPDHVLGVPDLLKICPDVHIYKHASSIPSLVEVTRPGADSQGADQIDENDTGGILEITDGQVFTTDGAKLTAIHSPGHTDDHISFLLEEESGAEEADDGAVFAGDNVLGHGTSVFEDLALYISSLGKMRQALKGPGLMYPAHGEVIQDGRAKIDEYVKHRKEREDQVMGILSSDREGESSQPADRSGWTSAELTRTIYRGVDEGLLDAAERNIKMILSKLEGDGKARKSEERWWATDKARF